MYVIYRIFLDLFKKWWCLNIQNYIIFLMYLNIMQYFYNLYNYVCIVFIYIVLKIIKQFEVEGNLRCFYFVDKIII